MVSFAIDIDMSIREEKLVRKQHWFNRTIQILFHLIEIVIFPFISILFICENWEDNEYLILLWPLLIASLVFSTLLIFSIINLDRIKRIKGIDQEWNKQVIVEAFNQQKWDIQDHENRMNIGTYDPLFSLYYSRKCFVIYDGSDILVNITTYDSHDFISPFHWFGNRKWERLLIEYIKNEKSIRQQQL